MQHLLLPLSSSLNYYKVLKWQVVDLCAGAVSWLDAVTVSHARQQQAYFPQCLTTIKNSSLICFWANLPKYYGYMIFLGHL